MTVLTGMGSRGVAFLGWLLLFTVSLLAFGLLVETALRVPVDAVDLSVSARLHGYASPLSDALMRGITGLGSTVFLVLLVTIVVIVLVTREERANALLVVTALVGTLVLNESLKLLFARPRPVFDWADPVVGPSFPSGHSMNSVVVYVVVGLVAVRVWGSRAGTVALVSGLVVAGSVGISRVYLGVHWATDVVGGVVAGALYLLVLLPASTCARRMLELSPSQRRGTREGP